MGSEDYEGGLWHLGTPACCTMGCPPGPWDLKARVEPAADLREAAKGMRALYVALTDEGFTPAEALAIIGDCLSGRR